jgi:hypothetical protein
VTADVRDRLRELTEVAEDRRRSTTAYGRYLDAARSETPWLVAALTAVLDLADEMSTRDLQESRAYAHMLRAVVAAAGDQP